MFSAHFTSRLVASVLATCACGIAHGAGLINSGTVDELLNDVVYPNLVFVSVSGSKSDSPACHTHTVWEFVLDTSTQQGVLQYVMLISSLKDGLIVDLIGDGSCNLHSATETLRRIELR
jgi:hypothetical protein